MELDAVRLSNFHFAIAKFNSPWNGGVQKYVNQKGERVRELSRLVDIDICIKYLVYQGGGKGVKECKSLST